MFGDAHEAADRLLRVADLDAQIAEGVEVVMSPFGLDDLAVFFNRRLISLLNILRRVS